MTILEAVKDGPAVCLMGRDRSYVTGDIAYQFDRPEEDSIFVYGTPVMCVNDKWVRTQIGKSIIKNPSDIVTVLD